MGAGSPMCDLGRGGGGSGTQKFVCHKWPGQIFPLVNLFFSRRWTLWSGGGGGGGPPRCTGQGWALGMPEAEPGRWIGRGAWAGQWAWAWAWGLGMGLCIGGGGDKATKGPSAAGEGPGRRSSKGPPVGLGGGQLLAHKIQRHVLLGGVTGGVDHGAVGPQPVPAIEPKRLLQRRNCCGKGTKKGAGSKGPLSGREA